MEKFKKKSELFLQLVGNREFMEELFEDDNNSSVISSALAKLDENVVLSEMSAEQVISHWDERGEVGELLVKSFESLPDLTKRDFIKDNEHYIAYYFENYPAKKNNRALIKLLGISDNSTKEDIMNKIKDILL